MAESTVDVLDRDARTLYDLACIRADRADATREDVDSKAIALRLWQNLAALAELIEADREYDAALLELHGQPADELDQRRFDAANARRAAALARVGH